MKLVPVPHRLNLPTTQIGPHYTISRDNTGDLEERARGLISEQLQDYAGYPEMQATILEEAIGDIRFSDEVDAAAARISSFVVRTALYDYAGLTIKDETEQPTRAYKIRGAANFILKNVEFNGRKRIVTASAGNHGQAFALVAATLGLKATIVVPRGTPKTKIDGIKAQGGEVFVYGADYAESSAKALELNKHYDALYVPAFNHPDIMAGQGTAAKELLEQAPDTLRLIVPTGGGGLLAGCARYLAVRAPQIAVFGAGIAGGSAVETAYKYGASTDTQPNKFADGIAVRHLGSLTWPEIKRHARGVLIANELSVRQTIGELSLRGRIVEGAGAVGIAAALLDKSSPLAGTAVLATGGNIDSDVLQQCQQLVQKPQSERLTKAAEFSTI